MRSIEFFISQSDVALRLVINFELPVWTAQIIDENDEIVIAVTESTLDQVMKTLALECDNLGG